MDEATYIAVSEAYMASLFRMAWSLTNNRHDAEDAVQQALLKAWKHRDRARPGAERAWMTRILINECHDLVRKRRRVVPVEDFPETAAPDTGGLSIASGLYGALQALPDSLRTPFLLKYMEGMTEKEVAASLGLTLPMVKHRLLRARKTLQKMLREEVAP